MNLIGIKFLLGATVKLNIDQIDGEAEIPAEVLNSIGYIVGIQMIDIKDFDKGIEYSVLFGDWVAHGILEDQIVRSKGKK